MSDEFQARELFEALLPALFVRQAEALRHLRGRVSIELTGRGPESWTIDFEPSPPHISRGVGLPADLRIEIDRAHVAPMLRGELDIEAAQTDGTVHAEGDRRLLAGLARALSPSSSLDLRLRIGRKNVP